MYLWSLKHIINKDSAVLVKCVSNPDCSLTLSTSLSSNVFSKHTGSWFPTVTDNWYQRLSKPKHCRDSCHVIWHIINCCVLLEKENERQTEKPGLGCTRNLTCRTGPWRSDNTSCASPLAYTASVSSTTRHELHYKIKLMTFKPTKTNRLTNISGLWQIYKTVSMYVNWCQC